MAQLKVFSGNFDGTQYRMVACSSRQKAMKLLGIPARRFDNYFSISKHPGDNEVAMESPSVVFAKPIVPAPGEVQSRIKV